MNNLDLSDLSNDQLVELARAVFCETRTRKIESLLAAVEDVGLDEKEKFEIEKKTIEKERAKFRALERERIAKAAAEKVRQENEFQSGSFAADKAREAVEKAQQRDDFRRGWIKKFASVLDRDPSDTTIVVLRDGEQNYRVLVNAGPEKYNRIHLVDFKTKTNIIKTKKSYISKKNELIKLCTEYAFLPNGTSIYCDEFDWNNQEGDDNE